VKRTLLLLIAAGGFAAIPVNANPQERLNPKEIVRRSIRNYERDWRASRNTWAWTQKDITENDGKRQVEVSEVIPLDGTPYERLIGKDGRPLTSDEQRKEAHKFERTVRQRDKESPAERTDRIRKYEHQREIVKDIPDAYDFSLVGDEPVDSRSAWIITMTPRAGFTPTTPHGGLLAHIRGKLWIDKEELQWAKAEAHVFDTISIGWILARVEPGTTFSVEQTRVENGLWMPRRITINGAAHVMLVHTKSISEELIYSGYRRKGAVSAKTF
jgi:hypothetical protein